MMAGENITYSGRIENYYTPNWSHPDVILRFSGISGPMLNEGSQTIADFGHRSDVNAYVEDQWHPLMLQGQHVPTAVFEAPAYIEVPQELGSYRYDYEVLGAK